MHSKRIGFLGYDGIVALDLVGPMDAFSAAASTSNRNEQPYEGVVIGLTERNFRANSGLTVSPNETIHSVGPLDTLVIPGGPGSRDQAVGEVVCPWLRSRAPYIRRVVSVCTGIFLLAPTGLLDGRRVTTHWAHATDLARRFPKLNVDPDALFVKSDRYYTSAGITAGIDLSLALIEEDCGSQTALGVARELVVYLKRTGGQRQYSDPLRLQAESGGQFSGLMSWIMKNLRQDLSVRTLADHVGLSRRHFTRLFTDTFAAGPAEVVEHLRLDQARTLLLESQAGIESVAATVGFSSSDSFRRAFSRRFGITPSQYREPFKAVH